MKQLTNNILLFLVILQGLTSCSAIKNTSNKNWSAVIRPGTIWRDNNENPIQAHGGGIIKIKNTWYWFGEYRGKDVQPGYRYVGCYSSKDLAHWTFLNKMKFSAPDGFSQEWILERPKVYFNKKTEKYVMYFHLDDNHYKRAEIGIAVSDCVDKGYHFVKHFRPFGMESRDIGQFIDDDGTAYLIFENRPTNGFVIARLSDNYMSLNKVCLVHKSLEGGAIVHYKGLYYVIGSHLTSWKPNPNDYATATSLEGPWTTFENIAAPNMNTYGSQSSNLLKVQGTKSKTVIFIGDIWKPSTQWDSRYLWMPLKMSNRKMYLPKPQPWKINIKTGKVKLIKKDSLDV
jgi:hypothetical protein